MELFWSAALRPLRIRSAAWLMYVRLLMVDGLAPGEREETDTKEGERMIVGKGRSTVVVVINYLLFTTVIINHLPLHSLSLFPLNCCFALCHTQHNSTYPLLSLSLSRADTHPYSTVPIQLSLPPSRHTHAHSLLRPHSLRHYTLPYRHRLRTSLVFTTASVSSFTSPATTTYHPWSPMRSAQ